MGGGGGCWCGFFFFKQKTAYEIYQCDWSSDVCSSDLKIRSKQLWQAAEIPTPSFVTLSSDSDWAAVTAELGLPLVVKPVSGGSSLGISRVDQQRQLEPAWRQAAQYDSAVIAESWIVGKEYTVAVLGDEVLPVMPLEIPSGFYDYRSQYEPDDTG